jgi:hypothetical protein
MKAIDSRIRRLQGRLCPDHGQPQRLWMLINPGYGLALDLDRCTQILDECGFLPKTRFGVVNLCGIPDGLNAKELEQFLRRNGEVPASGQEHSGAEGPGRPTYGSWSNQAQMASGGT